MHLVSLSSGDLRLERAPFDDNNTFSKVAKWTILDASNIASRKEVYTYNDVILKSPFGNCSTLNFQI